MTNVIDFAAYRSDRIANASAKDFSKSDYMSDPKFLNWIISQNALARRAGEPLPNYAQLAAAYTEQLRGA